jgi:hypothetical protein
VVANAAWTGSLASGFSTRSDTDSNIAASEFASFDSSLLTSITNGSPTLQAELRVQESIKDALVSKNSANLFYDTSTGKLYYDENSDVSPESNTEYMSYIHVATFQGTPSLSYMDFSVI